MRNDRDLYKLCFRTSLRISEQLDELLDISGIQMATWAKENSRTVVYSQHLQSRAEAVSLKKSLSGVFKDIPACKPPKIHIKPVKQEDWSETWKRYFHVMRCGKHIVVRPTWEKYSPKPGDVVIDMDPGMAFGSGHHGTTRSCLAFIEECAGTLKRGRILDIGCGSGILAIAASKSGCADVTAIDNDPDAIRVAEENIELNGLKGSIKCSTADLETFKPGRKYDVVAANILAEVLERFAVKIDRLVKPDGRLILSGVLIKQYDGVRRIFGKLGYRQKKAIVDREWKSGLFLKT